MKNIPVFIGQGGTATLILGEIPYKKQAYILLRTVLPGALEGLMAECVAFCRSCGAETCFLSSETEPLPLPETYRLLQLGVQRDRLPAPGPGVVLEPMTQENQETYRDLYNRCFREVSHALTYDHQQLQRLLLREDQTAYVARTPQGDLCGMGELHGSELAAVGILPEFRGQGLGRVLTLQLLDKCPGPRVTLTVVSDNDPALALYDDLGFTVQGTESVWHRYP